MGFHVCEYCQKATSSCDYILRFENARTWIMPEMILHYVAKHSYRPPLKFIDDVCDRIATPRQPSDRLPNKVGYLQGEYEEGKVPDDFFVKLWLCMQEAGQGDVIQTRGLKQDKPAQVRGQQVNTILVDEVVNSDIILRLAAEVYTAVYKATESFEMNHIGTDLAYLMGAILTGTVCVWSENRMILRILRDCLPCPHKVWTFIDVQAPK